MMTTAGTATHPNQYHLHGGHISVSYFPSGSGPIIEPGGATILFYNDAHHAFTFGSKEVQIVKVPGLGTVVSAHILANPDGPQTTISLLVPDVVLESGHTSATIHTDLITSIGKGFIHFIGQVQTYTVTHLVGTALNGAVPD